MSCCAESVSAGSRSVGSAPCASTLPGSSQAVPCEQCGYAVTATWHAADQPIWTVIAGPPVIFTAYAPANAIRSAWDTVPSATVPFSSSVVLSITFLQCSASGSQPGCVGMQVCEAPQCLTSLASGPCFQASPAQIEWMHLIRRHPLLQCMCRHHGRPVAAWWVPAASVKCIVGIYLMA
jgi:hypothetical protein